jgi:hypothetical protein
MLNAAKRARAVMPVRGVVAANGALRLRWAWHGAAAPAPTFVVFVNGAVAAVTQEREIDLSPMLAGRRARVAVLAVSERLAALDLAALAYEPPAGRRVALSLPAVDIASNPDFKSYEIAMSTDGSDPTEIVAELVGANNNTWLSDELSDGTGYKFRARLKDQCGNVSAWGATAAATVNGAPAAPTGAAVTYDPATRRATITAVKPASPAADTAHYALYSNYLPGVGLQEEIVDVPLGWEGLPPAVMVTGGGMPDVTGLYYQAGVHNGYPYYQRGTYLLYYLTAYQGRYIWDLSESFGGHTLYSWSASFANPGDGPAGTYTPNYSATGNDVVTVLGNAVEYITKELFAGRWIFEWRAVDRTGLRSTGARAELTLALSGGNLVSLGATPGAPELVDAKPAAGGTVKVKVRVLAVTAGDVLRFYRDGVLDGTKALAAGTFEYTYTTGALSDGVAYAFCATVASAGGAESAASDAVRATADAAAPVGDCTLSVSIAD